MACIPVIVPLPDAPSSQTLTAQQGSLFTSDSFPSESSLLLPGPTLGSLLQLSPRQDGAVSQVTLDCQSITSVLLGEEVSLTSSESMVASQATLTLVSSETFGSSISSPLVTQPSFSSYGDEITTTSLLGRPPLRSTSSTPQVEPTQPLLIVTEEPTTTESWTPATKSLDLVYTSLPGIPSSIDVTTIIEITARPSFPTVILSSSVPPRGPARSSVQSSIPVATTKSNDSTPSGADTGMIVGVTLGTMALVMLIAGFVFVRRRARSHEPSNTLFRTPSDKTIRSQKSMIDTTSDKISSSALKATVSIQNPVCHRRRHTHPPPS